LYKNKKKDLYVFSKPILYINIFKRANLFKFGKQS